MLDEVWSGATGPWATNGIAVADRDDVLRDMLEAMAGDDEYCWDITRERLTGWWTS